MPDLTITSLATKHTALPVKNVTIDGGFWGERLRINREVTLPAQYGQCRSTGRFEALKLLWKPGEPNEPHIFWDSDVAKWLEAASYSLASHYDVELEKQIDDVIALVADSQMPDGYINSHYACVAPEKRWSNVRDRHELYCAGHLIEAAVAHFEATGKRTLLDPLRRYADHIGEVFGTGPGQARGYCGHPEVELALVRLWRATGEDRFLALAKYFIDERGREPHYFDIEFAEHRQPLPIVLGGYAYMQADKPARDLATVTGHAVRAMYLYSAMTDVAAATGDEDLRAACLRLWEDVTRKKMYVTGGLGPSRHNEGFTHDFDLPNETAYAETCAAIGLMFWAQRMLHLERDVRYADVLELALYNGAIAGVSLGGDKFFYENPLSRHGAHARVGWFDCACCPPNLARMLSSVGTFAYSSDESEIAVHLYMNGRAKFDLANGSVTVNITTDYPWDGKVLIQPIINAATTFTLRLRVPGWCESARFSLNGESIEPLIEQGYAVVARTWQPGDVIEIALEMVVRRVYADVRVEADRGRVALMRGPLVYCAEEIDNGNGIDQIVVPRDATFATTYDPKLLGGVVTVTGFVARETDDPDAPLYRTAPPQMLPATLKAVPYYAWDNRGLGEMQVWLREG